MKIKIIRNYFSLLYCVYMFHINVSNGKSIKENEGLAFDSVVFTAIMES